ncbi:MAG: hypothetical protein ACREDZ_13165 [Kiloniellales bacterium]
MSLAEVDFFDWERLVDHYRRQVATSATSCGLIDAPQLLRRDQAFCHGDAPIS